jgi:hypothetical protein
MKKIISLFFLLLLYTQGFSQELLATVQVNSQQIGGSNQQAFKALEKSLRDFINNTSWTGKKLQNFEKIKCGFAIVISERDVNKFKGLLCRQYALFTIQRNPFAEPSGSEICFEYIENENLIFNERQFSVKTLQM